MKGGDLMTINGYNDGVHDIQGTAVLATSTDDNTAKCHGPSGVKG